MSTYILLDGCRIKNENFDIHDQLADIDAVNIFVDCYDPEKRTTINDCFNYYYNSGSCKIRYNVFIDNIFSMDESYSSYASDIDHYELYTSGKYSDEKYKMQMCDLFTEYVYNYTKEYHSSGVKWSLYYNAPVTEKVAKGAAKGFSEYIISKWS